MRFWGSCQLKPYLDGEVTSEIVQSEGGFDEGNLKARLGVAADVVNAAEDFDFGDAVLEAHRHPPLGVPAVQFGLPGLLISEI